MRLYALNGPPGAGKDTLANLVVERWPKVALTQCKRATLRMAAESSDLTPEVKAVIAEAWDPSTSHTFKDTPHPVLGGQTPRKVFIDFCNLMRERHGPDCFVVHTVKHVRELTRELEADGSSAVIIITDIGFQNELDVLAREFPTELCLVRIEREGHTFANDIRTYLDYKRSIPLHNDGTPDELYDQFAACDYF
jgi:hypothetical protein